MPSTRLLEDSSSVIGSYLVNRGKYLHGVGVYTWVYGFPMFLYSCSIIITAYKTYDSKLINKRMLGKPTDVDEEEEEGDHNV